jgi:hypothetical protein
MRMPSSSGLAALLAVVLAAGAGAAPPPELRRLRVLLVIDSDDSRIGKSVVIDRARITAALRLGIPAGKLDLTVLSGKKATPAAVRSYYSKLSSGPDEALLFYFCGHGAFRGNDHVLQFRDGELELPRSELRKLMAARKAALTVVLTDCCGTLLPVKKSDDVARKQYMIKTTPQVPGHLFLRARGVVDITAASKGQSAFGDDEVGGFFTLTFAGLLSWPVKSLDPDGDGLVTWAKVFPHLRKATNSTYRARGNPGKADQQAQDAHAFELPGKDSGQLVVPTIKPPLGKPPVIKPPVKPPLIDSDRRVFRTRDGRFVDQGKGLWLLEREDGKVFRYTEKRRTANYIELQDPTRKIAIALYKDHEKHYSPTKKQWIRGASGKWE